MRGGENSAVSAIDYNLWLYMAIIIITRSPCLRVDSELGETQQEGKLAENAEADKNEVE